MRNIFKNDKERENDIGKIILVVQILSRKTKKKSNR